MKERPYETSDLKQIMAVYHASIHSLAAPFYTAEQLDAWAPPKMDVERWRQRLASVRTIVAEDNGRIAGFASYELSGHLDFLFTHPAFARRGVAMRLYRLVESLMLAAGLSTVFTEASLAARPFFERQGFKVDAEEFSECRGQKLRRLRMSKKICPT
jgi:putative acetyltransferase